MFENTKHLVLKVTRGCNLRCDYCYVKNKDKYAKEVMDFETFKDIIDRIVIDKTKGIGSDTSIDVTFHGGEPLSIGYNNMARFLEYASKEFTLNNINVKFSIQSNMTLLNEKFINLLSKHNVSMGVSFDGVGKANSRRTKTVKTQAFKEKFSLLKKYNLHFGILMVATKQNIKSIKKSFKFLKKEYDIDSLKINYVEDVNSEGSGENEITGKEYVKYVIEPAIKSFIKGGYFNESNTNRLLERVFAESLLVLNHYERSSCYSKFCGGGQTIIEIEPTGKVFMCGRYSEEYDAAYIMESGDYDMLGVNQLQKHYNFQLEKTKHINNLKCDTCRADYLCDHGCMAFHYSKYGEYGIRKNLVCDIFINVEKIMMENLEDILINFIKKEYLRGPKDKPKAWFKVRFGDVLKTRNGRALKFLKKEGFKVSVENTKNGNGTDIVIDIPNKYIKKWSK